MMFLICFAKQHVSPALIKHVNFLFKVPVCLLHKINTHDVFGKTNILRKPFKATNNRRIEMLDNTTVSLRLKTVVNLL